ncbi:MAG: hypothetical protein AB3N15_13695 [Paracoccaceae bacterium]
MGQLLTGKTPLVVHATESWYEKLVRGEIDFFEKIAASASENGHKPLLVRAKTVKSRLALTMDHKHIVVGLRKAQRARILHAHTSYLWGFWYLDPKGYYWTSSLAGTQFDAAAIDPGSAKYFFDGVSGHMTRENISRLAQPARSDVPLTPAAATVFLQEIDNFKTPVHYLDTPEMIRHTALAIKDRVNVKLHPAQSDQTRPRVLQLCTEFPNVGVSSENVHELIQASAVTVSQNSAAGFEALMHKRPVVTCGRSDYHHATLVARTGEELQNSVRTAPQALGNFPYEQYFFWFLRENMLEPQKGDFLDRAWTRIRKL